MHYSIVKKLCMYVKNFLTDGKVLNQDGDMELLYKGINKMAYELFAVGSFWFFLFFLIVPSCVLMYFLEDDESHFVASGFTVAFCLITLHLLSSFNAIHLIQSYWKFSIIFSIGYLTIGTLWGILKWKFYIEKQHNKYLGFKRNFKTKLGINTEDIPDEYKEKFLRDFQYEFHYMHIIPQVDKNKERIITWMTFWPWSALWTLLNDPIRAFYNYVYNKIANVLQGMVKKRFADATRDLGTHDEK